MPIRKQNKDDFMSREMDERLSEMEASISNVYQQAVEETTARLNSYMQAYEEENRVMRARLIEGEITEKEYEEWARRNLLRTQQYSTTIDSLTEMLVNADTAAIALVNGELPYVIAESYNYTQFVGHIIADHDDIPNVSFEIYNAQSVQAIIRDNPQILPVVDPELDTEWNRTRLNREITQGIIQGNTIPQLATRLQRVGITDRNSAIRAARTSMTSAENMGRNESHRRITSQGINMVKRWSATYDARTRDTHRLLDDTTANEKGEFGEGILDKLDEPLMEFPGDPKGAAAERYNCRCRLNIVPPDYSREANAQAYEKWMQENYPADYRALNESNYFDRLHKTDEWTAEAQRRVDRRIEKLREAERQDEQAQPIFNNRTAIAESEFVPASSISDAENYARENFVEPRFGINFTGYDVSFSGIDLDVANTINRRLNTIYQNFDIEPLTSLESFGKKNKRMFAKDGEAPMCTSPFGSIGLNNTFLKNAKTISAYTTEGRESFDYVISNIDRLTGRQLELARTYQAAGRTLVDDSIEGMITHEVGHRISFMSNMNSIFGNIGRNTDWQSYAQQLSGYSNASFNEYVAESFIAYFNGEYDRLQPEIIEVFDSLRRQA